VDQPNKLLWGGARDRGKRAVAVEGSLLSRWVRIFSITTGSSRLWLPRQLLQALPYLLHPCSRASPYLIHAVVGIAFQQALPLQEASDALCEGLGQPGELGARRCFHPTEPHRALRALDICPVEEKHVGRLLRI
jgi:hypothetical protein